MMELLSELLLTGALSFLISLLLAKFVSSSLTADHLRHGVVSAHSPLPTAAAGGKTSSTETSVGLEERMEKDGAIQVELARSVSGDETSGFGTVGDKLIKKEHVAGCDGVGEMRPMVSVREENNLARVMEGGSGFEEEKIVEQSFCSDVVDELGIVLVFEGEKRTTKEIVIDGGVGVTGVEDEDTNEIISESDTGVNTGDDEFERELVKAVRFKAMANEYDCKEAKEVISENEIGVEGMEDEGQGRTLPNECDDWEGIERSDTEKLFVVASEFGNTAGGKEALSQLSDDLQMRLYGLHKIATEGPCYQTQPLILKLSARARWHSWQKLGSMDPEVAMEQYIDLLSDSFPEWLEGRFRDESKTEGDYSSGDDKSGSGYPTTSSGQDQHLLETKRNA